MPEEKNLDLRGSVSDDDKVRIVAKDGLSQSITVGNLKSSLLIDGLPDRVLTLEDKADDNEAAHTSMSSDIALLKSTVGKEEVNGETVTNSGLFEKISNVRSDLSTLHLHEVSRLDGELGEIRGRLILIDHETEGDLAVLTNRQGILEGDVANLANTKLDQSAFQNAVDAGFKMIGKTLASASAAGEPGEVRWDADYLYVCVETNTWKRIPFPAWDITE